MTTQKSSARSWLFCNTRIILFGAVILALSVLLHGCGYNGLTPLEELRTRYKDTATYSIVLEDTKEEGEYYQKFIIIFPDSAAGKDQILTTEWWRTSKKDFEALLPFLGMTVFAKKDGKETSEANPPGYEYVGDKRYGEWQQSSGGTSIWMWYLGYRMMGGMFGTGSISRSSYDAYRTDRASGKPYFGPNKQYGTQGSYTKQKHPSFYERHNSKKLANRATFSKKVNSRIGRNSVAVRSRSGGVGK